MYSRMRRSRRSTVQQRDLFGMQVTEEEKTDDDEVPEEEEEEDEDESETGKVECNLYKSAWFVNSSVKGYYGCSINTIDV